MTPPAGTEFATHFQAEVERALPTLSTQAQVLLTAHAALEAGWGISKAWTKACNFGNITHAKGDGWTGGSWTDVGGDLEYPRDGGPPRRIDQVWRSYPDVQAAIADYWAFLGVPWRLPARNALERANLPTFTAGLYHCRYYTLDPAEYQLRLSRTLARVYECLATEHPSPTPPPQSQLVVQSFPPPPVDPSEPV